MKGYVIADMETRTARIDLSIETLEEGGSALDAIKNALRAVWPDIYFSGLDDPPEAPEVDEVASRAPQGEAIESRKASPMAPAAATKVKRPQKPKDFSRPPQPGTPAMQILEAARRLKTTDAVKIADALDLKTRIAAMRLGMLRKGGHLVGLE